MLGLVGSPGTFDCPSSMGVVFEWTGPDGRIDEPDPLPLLILPIDIFLRNPHLPFSFPPLTSRSPPDGVAGRPVEGNATLPSSPSSSSIPSDPLAGRYVAELTGFDPAALPRLANLFGGGILGGGAPSPMAELVKDGVAARPSTGEVGLVEAADEEFDGSLPRPRPR